MQPAGYFGPATPADERLQTHTSDRAFTGISWVTFCVQLITVLSVVNYYNPFYHISDEEETLRKSHLKEQRSPSVVVDETTVTK
jgi:hypothetical protein